MREISRDYSKLLVPGLIQEDKKQLSEGIRSAENELESLKREIRTTSPAYADLKYPRVITYDEVQAELTKPREAFVNYSVGNDVSYAFIIIKKGLKIYSFPPKKALQQQVVAYRKAIGDLENRDFNR